jgi:hypothetical protein
MPGCPAGHSAPEEKKGAARSAGADRGELRPDKPLGSNIYIWERFLHGYMGSPIRRWLTVTRSYRTSVRPGWAVWRSVFSLIGCRWAYVRDIEAAGRLDVDVSPRSASR